jgi:glycosyltransferase involved in cell wall biosynthesis
MRVLLSAFACAPEKGSEPEVGWQWALQIARFHDVTVLTQYKYGPAIEKALKSSPSSQPAPRFVYFDRPQWLQKLQKHPIGVRLYYVLWQIGARPFVQKLLAENRFDLLHHVTFATFRYPTVIWGQGVPCVWGPIGGIESIPLPLLPWSHPISLVEEGFRNITNLLAATRFRNLPNRGAASNKVLVTTHEMQATFTKLGIQSQLMPTIGLKTSEFPFRPHRPSEGPLKILFVGKIISWKGIDLALEALSESATDATLTFVGTGNYLPAARRLAQKLGLGERATFRGRITRQEVLAMYPEFDLLLHPSLHDTGGYVVIEAMFNELPVICLDCGGPAAAVENGCGIKVPLKSRRTLIAGLASAIRYYDKDRQALLTHGRAAREAVLKNYDLDRKGEQMNEVYQEVLAQANDRGKNKSAPALVAPAKF